MMRLLDLIDIDDPFRTMVWYRPDYMSFMLVDHPLDGGELHNLSPRRPKSGSDTDKTRNRLF